MKPSCIAWCVMLKAPEITAWLAMKVATVARMTSGRRNSSLASKKNGLRTTSTACSGGRPAIIAPWPK